MIVESLTQWILRYRALVLVITVLLVAASALGLSKIQVTADYRVMFSEDYPQLLAFDRMQETFGQQDNIMIVLAPDDGEVFTNRTLHAIEELTRQAWKTPFSKRVDSLSNFQDTYPDGDDLIVRSLARDALHLSQAELAEIRRIALNEPLLVNRIVSAGGHVTAVNITMNFPHGDLSGHSAAVTHARKLMADLEQSAPWIKTYLTGEIMMGQTVKEAGDLDVRTLFPIMFTLILLVTWLFLRSLWAIFSVTLVIVLSTLSAFGLSGHLAIEHSLITGSSAVVILTLAVADSVHLLVTLFQELRQGNNKRQAIIESMRVNIEPIFLTSITTGIGFLSLNFSESPPFRAMGNIVALGVGFAFLFSVISLPALLSYVPIRPGKPSELGARLMDRCADFALRHRPELGVGFALILLFTAHGVTLNQFNDVFTKMFGERLTFRQHTDFVEENLTGVMLIHHIVDSGQAGGIFEPDYLADLDKLVHWYEAQPGVMHVESYSDIVRRLNRTIHGGDELYYRTPDKADLAAQYHLLYEMSLPYGLDVNNLVDINMQTTRLTVTMAGVESNMIVAADTNARAFARDNLPALQLGEGVGPSVMLGHMGKANGEAMIAGAVLAVTSISVIIALVLRDLRLGLLSILPNLAPGIIAFGLWGMFSGRLSFAAVPALVIAFGIVVDNTVHFLSKYLRARRLGGKSVEQAIHYSYHRVGTALGVTSSILTAGFLVLLFSSVSINRFIGLMTALSLAISLAITYLILPTILSWLDRKQRYGDNPGLVDRSN